MVMRKAEGLEHQEKHQQTLDQWTLLVSKGFTTKLVMDGKRRCQMILTPKSAPKTAPKTAKPAVRPTAKPASSAPTPAGKYENLDRVRASHAKIAKEEAEKAALGDVVAVKIETWRSGNEDNKYIIWTYIYLYDHYASIEIYTGLDICILSLSLNNSIAY